MKLPEKYKLWPEVYSSSDSRGQCGKSNVRNFAVVDSATKQIRNSLYEGITSRDYRRSTTTLVAGSEVVR